MTEYTLDDIEDDLKSIIDANSENEFVMNIATEENTSVVEVEDTPTELELVQDGSTSDFDVDFDYIRGNIKDVIKLGSKALEQMLRVASASQHPRAYEVVATLMKALVDSNKELINSHKMKDERVDNSSKTTNIQTNNVFVGSTREFSKMMKERKMAEKEIELDE